MSRKAKTVSLAQQIVDLSNPKPSTFHPDEEELRAATAAKVCDFDYEGGEEVPVISHNLRLGRGLGDEDPRYAGKAVSRRDLETVFEGEQDDINLEQYDSESGQSDESSDMNSLTGEESITVEPAASENDDIISDQSDLSEDDQSESSEGDDITSDQSDLEEGEEETSTGFTTISLHSVQDDVEKGQAAKQQIGMWDSLLEARIRLQQTLSLCNRMPQYETLPDFQREGSQQLEAALRDNRSMLGNLLDNLLELQQVLLGKNKETVSLLGGGEGTPGNDSSGTSGDSSDDDEILSDDEDGMMDVAMATNDAVDDSKQNGDDSEQSGSKEGSDVAMATRMKRKRKRKLHEWILPSGKRDYEGHIARLHESFKPYQDATITKWNNKTRLASGKLTSRAFIQLDHSVLAQIQHVLSDRQRLVKRTQLKRSVYRVLGKEEEEEEGESGGGESRDTHLKDYDDEIFDDDDFYHQLLRELIERKMNFSETTDPIAMGRQWLELQKLKSKVKKKVDTKASKGRKIRYNVHPKLVSFMAPIQRGTLSDVSRNDLFSSLFGVQFQER